jgi:ADP-ribosylglycohydrolase
MKNNSNTIIGAIAGDIIGSVYEFDNIKTTNFPLFIPASDYTDDTVLTIAVADCLCNHKPFATTIWKYGRAYPNKGYGGNFIKWLYSENPEPYGSYGNGSAMRVSPVGFACDTMKEVLEIAKQSAAVSHNHKEGIKGAQAVAAAIFLAKQRQSKQEIKEFISKTFDYDLEFSLNDIRPFYSFDVSCQGSVPQAIVAFLESDDFENALRLAVSMGGDSDTIACITGGIAAAFYKEIPDEIIENVLRILPDEFITVLNEFEKFLHNKK